MCEVDLYGVGCTQTCSEECLNGKCDPETGICACPEGQSWDGENCQETGMASFYTSNPLCLNCCIF